MFFYILNPKLYTRENVDREPLYVASLLLFLFSLYSLCDDLLNEAKNEYIFSIYLFSDDLLN